MLRVLLEAARLPDQPLKKLCYEMSWDIVFTHEDIASFEIFVSLMDPMEKLFSSLNSEKESTIHLCYPTVLVTSYKMFSLKNISFIGISCQSLSFGCRPEQCCSHLCQET